MRRHRLGLLVVVGMTALALTAITPAGAAGTKPGAPGRPTAVPGNKSARVSWPAPKNGGSPITIYLVTPFIGAKAQAKVAFHSKKTSEVVAGLKNGVTYTFKVAGHNKFGTGKLSAASKPVKIGLPSSGPPTGPPTTTPAGPVPSAPTRVTVAPGNAQATVAWQAPATTGSGISSYVVTPYVGAVGQTPQTFGTSATVEVVTGLTNSQTYSFRVAARNAAGLGPQSALSASVKITAGPALSTVHNTKLNKNILVDAYGNTVYLYGPDGSGTVSTAGGELATWPAVTWSGTPTLGPGLSAAATVDIQADGTRQLAYNGHLLYTFVADSAPGDATGDGIASFYLLTPAGTQT
jgi:predicted lipoprotein with Yx(FWY)xxD motif